MTATTETIATATVQAEEGQTLHLATADVILEDNIRDVLSIEDIAKGFRESVKQHGVLIPTIGYRNAEGVVVIRDGQLRYLAAQDAGRTIPVYITARELTEARRVIEQLATNDHRTGLSERQRLAAYRQLELGGMSMTAIAKQTATSRDTVKKTLAVAKSDAATVAVVEHQLSFDAALLIAEFEDDEEAIAELHDVAARWPSHLEHTAAQLRAQRANAAKRDELTTTYTGEGIRVVGEDDYSERLHNLTDATDDAADRPAVDAEAHTACPGHAVDIQVYNSGETARITPVCTTPDAHNKRYSYSGNKTTDAYTVPNTGGWTDEQKAARRLLVARNTEWEAAEGVRRAWLVEFIGRRKLPTDAPLFVAQTLTTFSRLVSDDSGKGHACCALGLDTEGYGDRDRLADYAAKNPTKADRVTLAVALSAFEHASDRGWWRNPTTDSRTYLGQLHAWGYTLSTVEKLAMGQTEEEIATAQTETVAE